jgi:rhombotail lipoprotein
MKVRAVIFLVVMTSALAGCTVIQHAFCAPGCQSQAHNSSSLVSFLYPDGKAPPANNTIPELHVPLRVGLAFLPSQPSYGAAALGEAQKQDLLERIRQRFSTRKFVSEIVLIPDYYLGTNKGFAGLDGVQRLYNVDLMALVSYDQVAHKDDNKLSLGYLTIVGAYVLPGTSHDTATLVDLAVVDPKTRSLVLRAGGTNSSQGTSTLINSDREARKASASGFDEATNQMIGNFDTALTGFEADVHAGKANVRVVDRNAPAGSAGGGGSIGLWETLALIILTAVQKFRQPAPTRRAPCRIARSSLTESRESGRYGRHSHSPMSSFHTSGWRSMKDASSCSHSSEPISMTSTPCSRNQSIPPRNVRDSPTITFMTRNCRTSPLQYQHGASVVTMMVS